MARDNVLAVSVVLGATVSPVSSRRIRRRFHGLSQQLLEQMLAKNAVLLTGQFGHALRDRLDNLPRRPCSTSREAGYSAKKSSITDHHSVMTYLSFRSNSGSHSLCLPLVNLPCVFGHSADTGILLMAFRSAKPLKYLVGAQGLEPWTR